MSMPIILNLIRGRRAGRRSTRNERIIAALIAAALIVILALWAAGVFANNFTATGSFVVDSATTTGTSCTSGQSDVMAGTPVEITDPAGTIVGLGHLKAGQVTDRGCSFSYAVPHIPANKAAYGVRLGEHPIYPTTKDALSKGLVLMSG